MWLRHVLVVSSRMENVLSKLVFSYETILTIIIQSPSSRHVSFVLFQEKFRELKRGEELASQNV